MNAYVQKGQEGDPNYSNLEQTAYGFWERGYEVLRFRYPELGEGRLDRALLDFPDESIVVGGVGTIREALQRAGRPLPENLDLPDCLRPWIGRNFWPSTLAEVRKRVTEADYKQPLHVKPLRHQKKFKGTVIRAFRDVIPLAAVDGELPVLVQEVVQFVTEWRAYILRGKIIKVAHYLGDPIRFPDQDIMQAALGAFTNSPIAFGMDWGVTDEGHTRLVEVNDGFALGNYGVRQFQYTAMIEARWRELMGLPDHGIGERLP